jgi:hypothetical protein
MNYEETFTGLDHCRIAPQTPPPNTVERRSEGQFTLKTSTEVVLVRDRRDKNDNPIKDLKVQDFTIVRKKQDIISRRRKHDSVVTAETPQLELLTKLSTTTNATTSAPPTTPTDVNE